VGKYCGGAKRYSRPRGFNIAGASDPVAPAVPTPLGGGTDSPDGVASRQIFGASASVILSVCLSVHRRISKNHVSKLHEILVCVDIFFMSTNSDQCFNGSTVKARDSEWQWHQLGHMQVCTSLQTDNHASTPPLTFLHHSVFYRPDALPAAQPTASKH